MMAGILCSRRSCRAGPLPDRSRRSAEKTVVIRVPFAPPARHQRHPGQTLHPHQKEPQSNRLDTELSLEIRLIASPMSCATVSTRTLEVPRTPSLGRMLSVITSRSSELAAILATAPADSTPCVT